MPHDPNKVAAAGLCLDCGLCCNGVMFDRVILQREDNRKALTALGLKIKKRSFFTQPCTALCGVQCAIYEDRPMRCRVFECRTYQQVAAGQTSKETAIQRIQEVKQQVIEMERLLGAAGGTNLRKSIAQRHAAAMPQTPDAEPESLPRHAELVEAMATLNATLSEHFRVD